MWTDRRAHTHTHTHTHIAEVILYHCIGQTIRLQSELLKLIILATLLPNMAT